MRCVYLQLPEFKKTKEECETLFDQFIYTLKVMNATEHMPFKENYIFSRLEEVAKTRALNPQERALYDRSLKKFRDAVNVMQYERAEGRAEGLIKGRAEERAAIAANMLRLGMPIATIVQATGLTEDEVQKL